MSGNPDKLDGWGSIELHLGVTRRAVLRRGYPLHYHLTGKVYALKSELAAHETSTNVHKRPLTSISTPA